MHFTVTPFFSSSNNKIAVAKRLFFFLVFIFCKNICFGQYSLGMLMDDSKYKESPRLKTGGKANVTEPRVSLKSFTPLPGDQGQCSSCVGWSIGYAGLTTAWAIAENVTNKTQITEHVKSPMFLYVQIAPNCESASAITNAFKVAMNIGDCLKLEFDPFTFSTNGIEDAKKKAVAFKIKDYAALWDVNANAETIINNTRLSLQNKKPVIIGATVYSSFTNLNSQNNIWQPDIQSEQSLGGHAMCVIGYDDVTETFEIMNSWGKSWGNEGYFKIKYDVYAKVVKYGYNFTLDIPTQLSKYAVTGRFKVEHITGLSNDEKLLSNEVNPKLAGDSYLLDEPIRVGDYYRLFAYDLKKDTYVYVFSINAENKGEILFPFSKNERFSKMHNLDSAITEVTRVYDNELIEIPGLNHGIQFKEEGEDNLIILYCNNPINNINDVLLNFQIHKNGSLMERLKSVLGDRIMDSSEINYAEHGISINARSNHADIVPIFLTANVQQ